MSLRFKGGWPALPALLIAVVMTGAAQQSGSAPAGPRSEAASLSDAPMTSRELRQALSAKEFSPQVAQAVLEELSAGMEDHDYDRVAAIFDRNSFGSDFFRHMRAAFEYIPSYSVYYHLQSATEESDGATVEVDFRVQAEPRDASLPSRRTETQLTFALARTAPDGKPPAWRIVKVTPPDFLFSY